MANPMPRPLPDSPPVAGRTDVVIGIVTRAGTVLICQRPDGKSFPRYWEFPGGKREPGETVEACLRRELREELAIDVSPVHGFPVVDNDYPGGKIRLHPFACTVVRGEPRPLACEQVRWVMPGELKDYQFPPANEELIAEVVEFLSGGPASAPVDFPARQA